MGARADILGMLEGQKAGPAPAFSGLVHVIKAGAGSEAIRFAEAHKDAGKMSRLAASAFKSSGIPSAAVPFDLCAEAEALGAEVDFMEAGDFEFPRITHPRYEKLEELESALETSQTLGGRIPVVCEAIKLLKEETGQGAVISGILAGPFTVLSLLLEPAQLYNYMKKDPDRIAGVLSYIAAYSSQVGMRYRDSGADFLTIHEMGGSPGILGPANFERLVFPALQVLLDSLPAPRVLAACGRLEGTLPLLGETYAEAISIDQSNKLSAVRKVIPGKILLGNLDPVGTLLNGSPEQVEREREQAMQDGADAIWPGCDLHPAMPIANLEALVR